MIRSRRWKKGAVALLVVGALLFPEAGALAWSEHPLITRPVVAGMPEVASARAVRVEALGAFLSAERRGIERLLLAEEAWARENLPWYPPLPAPLVFRAEGQPGPLEERFSHAIRVNPRSGFPLYLQRLPGSGTSGQKPLSPSRISTLSDTGDWSGTPFVTLQAGDMAEPLEVVVSATDEPDLLGLDIGLFADNPGELGKAYGFGPQPFGNPNLEYGSQAPFHMGFFHESRLIRALAPFLDRTLPEYRIRLYRQLARFAFATGHPYWGWRFAGIGLHYLADLAQPYHASALPGTGPARLLLISALDRAGIRGPKNDAVQLVSNRHTALEKFVQEVLRQAYLSGHADHPILAALLAAADTPPYSDRVPREALARLANRRAAETDRILRETMPERFVSDPGFELGTSPERGRIVERMRLEKGDGAVARLTAWAAELLAPFAGHGRAYVRAILK